MQTIGVQPETKTDEPQNIYYKVTISEPSLESRIDPSDTTYHKVTIEEAKTQIAGLLEAVLRGEDVFIVKD
jgi:hypothetical protein